MAYKKVPYLPLKDFIQEIFERCGFRARDGETIADVLLTADLFGIESHGIQRMIRYHRAIEEGSIDPAAPWNVVRQTPVSCVIDAPRSMGQIAGARAMRMAMEKAKGVGIGCVCVRGSNHYGIAGYYTRMAAREDLMGISMTNTEAIAIPTGGRQAMLGTSPIALCMPADPVPFWYDAATTVVTRGKLEVMNKRDAPLPLGWAADETGAPTANAALVIDNIIRKAGGGIFPLGGYAEETGSHKGYGLGVIVELFTSLFAGGTTSPHVKNSGNADTSFCMIAVDYGIFGDKTEIKARVSELLAELRESPRAEGCPRIYTHGEKEWEAAARIRTEGIAVNDKTWSELMSIALSVGMEPERYPMMGGIVQ